MKNSKGRNLNIIGLIDELDYILCHLSKNCEGDVCHNNFDVVKNYINSGNNKENRVLDFMNSMKKIFREENNEDYCCDRKYES
ncbi:hypothetical protein C922_05800 [Plasmodium inui San Antonio 1]|uniref:Uncharacterized protein n=1 Tax=Plasmodium inui San Antonio 1 TaxID=1237626 RepID=W7A403_9APIC|nr:hypothetical protein C922_05800 [Plasmodium inui San Antonio 1]EUD63819.1 hypothetical protein C922_05800 [Plasmodium inui San Antonio 1]